MIVCTFADISMVPLVQGDPEITANTYCKSRNLPNTQNYSTDLRQLLGHPVSMVPLVNGVGLVYKKRKDSNT